LNPTNPNTYDVLADLYSEFIMSFGSDLFHMGGDEVNFGCWNSSQPIIDWLRLHGKPRTPAEFQALWGQFQVTALRRLFSENIDTVKSVILWTSELTNTQSLLDTYLAPDKDKYIVESWDFSSRKIVPYLVANGFRVIVANADALYLDCGFGDFVSGGQSWCDPFKTWQKIYTNRLDQSENGSWIITDPAQRSLILGGEVAMWSEVVSEYSVDTKLWPRSCAAAERFWSDPRDSWQPAKPRIMVQQDRMVRRGIRADAVQPYWCFQNQADCY